MFPTFFPSWIPNLDLDIIIIIIIKQECTLSWIYISSRVERYFFFILQKFATIDIFVGDQYIIMDFNKIHDNS